MWQEINLTRECPVQARDNRVLLGSAAECGPTLLDLYRGQVQCVYLDPPFFTGDTFTTRVRLGASGWKTGKPSAILPAYCDAFESRQEYLSMMRNMLETSRELLSDTGVLFLHIDTRMSAHLRLLMDEVFGEKNFLNEIVWEYQTGGRATKHFSRKHDTIFLYGKTPRYYFNILQVPISRTENRANHMRRQVDENGRVYRTINVSGKTYTYYDDTPTYPSDVWRDISHLQQKDPQRTGYDTQKPQKLLERMILSTTKPGDLVCDLCCGSGTALAAAHTLGRRFVGVDVGKSAIAVTHKRLMDSGCLFDIPCAGYTAVLNAPPLPSVGLSGIELVDFALPEEVLSSVRFEPEGYCPAGLDLIDQVAFGIIRENTFIPLSQQARTYRHPALDNIMQAPLLHGDMAVEIIDVLAGKHVFKWSEA